MTAFDVADGEQLWQSRAPAPLVSTPVVVGNAIVAAMQDNSDLLIAFDLESGVEQWSAAPPATE